jgi:hypothetical protein
VSRDSGSRPVYSTAGGRLCPACGWPERDCKCSSQFAKDAAVPAKVVAKLRLEKSGRGGKTVTVVYDPRKPQTVLVGPSRSRTYLVGAVVFGAIAVIMVGVALIVR